MKKLSLNSCSKAELTDIVLSVGDKAFRGKQLYNWLYSNKVLSFEDIQNIPKDTMDQISAIAEINILKEQTRTVSKIDGSMKLLLTLPDGARIETVLLRDRKRVTACVSTQVGCKMGCRFCATGRIGFKRDLTTSEILEQVRMLEKITFEEGYTEEGRLTNIVFMGMGEPLDNFNNLFKALEILTDTEAYGYSHKRITVSTVGISNKILRLWDLPHPVRLAISLNASNQETREKIMPIAKSNPLERLFRDLRRIPLGRKEEITFEYVLLDGINSSQDNAREFIKLLKSNSSLNAKVNLIIYNGGGEEQFRPPNEKTIEDFQTFLTNAGIKVFLRKSLGADIWGACGMLAAEYKTDEKLLTKK